MANYEDDDVIEVKLEDANESSTDVFEIFQYDADEDGSDAAAANNAIEEEKWWQENDALPLQCAILEQQLEEEEELQTTLYCEENLCNCKSFLPDEITEMYHYFANMTFFRQQKLLLKNIQVVRLSGQHKSSIQFVLQNSDNVSLEVCKHFFKNVYRLQANRLADLIKQACVKQKKLKLPRPECNRNDSANCCCKSFDTEKVNKLRGLFGKLPDEAKFKLVTLGIKPTTNGCSFMLDKELNREVAVCLSLFAYAFCITETEVLCICDQLNIKFHNAVPSTRSTQVPNFVDCVNTQCGCRNFSLMEADSLRRQYKALGFGIKQQVMRSQMSYYPDIDAFTYSLTHNSGFKYMVCKSLFSFVYDQTDLQVFQTLVKHDAVNEFRKRKLETTEPAAVINKERKIDDKPTKKNNEPCDDYCHCYTLSEEKKQSYFSEIKNFKEEKTLRILIERVICIKPMKDYLKKKFEYYLPNDGVLERTCEKSFCNIYRLSNVIAIMLQNRAKRNIKCKHDNNHYCQFKNIPNDQIDNTYKNYAQLNDIKNQANFLQNFIKYQNVNTPNTFSYYLPHNQSLIRVCDKSFARVLRFERVKLFHLIQTSFYPYWAAQAQQINVQSSIMSPISSNFTTSNDAIQIMYSQMLFPQLKLLELNCTNVGFICKCPSLSAKTSQELQAQLKQLTSVADKYTLLSKQMKFEELPRTTGETAASYVLKLYVCNETKPICRKHFCTLYQVLMPTLLNLIPIAFNNMKMEKCENLCLLPQCNCVCITQLEKRRNFDLYQNLETSAKFKFLLSQIKYRPTQESNKRANDAYQDLFEYYLFGKSQQLSPVCVKKFCKLWQLSVGALMQLQENAQNQQNVITVGLSASKPAPITEAELAEIAIRGAAKGLLIRKVCDDATCSFKCSTLNFSLNSIRNSFAALNENEQHITLMSLMKLGPIKDSVSFYIQHSTMQKMQVCEHTFCYCYNVSPDRLKVLIQQIKEDANTTSCEFSSYSLEDSGSMQSEYDSIVIKHVRNVNAELQIKYEISDLAQMTQDEEEEEQILGL